MMRWRRSEPHTLAGAYAMDAVAGADRARFERHLDGCQACARELRGLREATAHLAGAVAAELPAEVIERAVAAAARTRQLPPATGATRAWPRARRAERAGRAPGLGRAWQALPRAVALALGVALLATAAASGALALRAEHRLGQAEVRDAAIARVLTARDAVMLTARVRAGGTATVVMSRLDRSLVLTTAGLPPLPRDRCYQLWLMGPGGDLSAGMLPAPRGGTTSPVIASGLAAGDRVGLTVEPEGGSTRPTSTPILMLSLPA